VIRTALDEVSLADLAAPAAVPLRRMDFRQAIGRDVQAN